MIKEVAVALGALISIMMCRTETFEGIRGMNLKKKDRIRVPPTKWKHIVNRQKCVIWHEVPL